MPTIAVADCRPPHDRAWQRPSGPQPELRVRDFARAGFDFEWQTSSYSSLTRPAGDSEDENKRGGVKDSGGLFPGIGGILDLLDSLLFNAPIMYLYLRHILTPP